jgi:uncharacterized protein (UPF0335 family)
MSKKIATSDKNVRKFQFTKTLKVSLTEAEILEFADQLARAVDNVTRLEEEKKTLVDSYKAKITEAEAATQKLTNLVRNKYDFRPVDCEQTMDNNEGTSKTVRLDTGETIEDRKLTYEERQGKLWEEESA